MNKMNSAQPTAFIGYSDELGLDKVIEQYRNAGYLLHEEVIPEHNLSRWYAADPDWVQRYLDNGGLWSYTS